MAALRPTNLQVLVATRATAPAVVVGYQDEHEPYDRERLEAPAAYRIVSAANLCAVRPSGGTTQLIHPEGVQVWGIDVAHVLVVDGRFGGPSSEPAAWWIYYLVLTPTVGLLQLVVVVVRWRRRACRWRSIR